MPKYIKCPRCELNYILETEKLCPVCQAELKLRKDDSLSDDMELCPICGQNFVSYDQPMCEECAKKRSLDDIVDEDTDDEEYSRDEVSEFSDIDSAVEDDVEIVPFADLDGDDDEDEEDDENEDSAVDSANYDDFESDFNYDIDEDDDEDDDYDEDDYDEDDDEDDED